LQDKDHLGEGNKAIARQDLNNKDPYGRLLKREKIPAPNEHFVLQEYKWMDFNSEAIVFPDNARATLVISDLHDPEELRQRVQIPKAFGAKFRPASTPLYPVDLSEDYRKFVAETLQRRKRRNFDDDDDAAEIDFSEISTPPDLEDRLTRWKKQKGEDENQGEAVAPVVHADRHQDKEASPRRDGAKSINGEDLQTSSSGKSASPEVRKGMRPAADISQEARDRILAKLNASTGSGSSSGQSLADDGEGDDDDHMEAEAARAADQVEMELDAEADAEAEVEADAEVAQHQRALGHQDNSGLNQDGLDLNNMRTDAEGEKSFAAGYQNGYENAVEKFRDLFAALESTSTEIQSLRSKVMSEGRDIFLEMIKLTAEGVLRSQLAFSDDALGDLFRSALESVHQARRITVQANPETLARLKSQFSEAKLEFEAIDWVASDKSPRGDFRVISKDEVIKVDLENLVSKKVSALAKDIFSAARGETAASTAAPAPAASAAPAESDSTSENQERDPTGSDDKEAG
jgi:flagellar biosynthesis/type III secretory pathway protein FliH